MRRLVLVALVVCVLVGTAWGAVPETITIQGRLTDSSGTAVPPGTKTFIFKIYDAPIGGSEIWPLVVAEEAHLITTDVAGLWTAAVGETYPLTDPVFADSVRWLQVTVDGTPLPMIRLATGPYAYRVATVDGASGGTITSKVSIGPGHTNTGSHAFVAGSDNEVTSNYSTVGGGTLNHATGESSVIAGGQQNTSSGFASAVAGGASNTASNTHASVGGGLYNVSSGSWSLVDGGILNSATGDGAVVGGGRNNHARGLYATVAGGGGETDADSNLAGGTGAAIGGGMANVASGQASTVDGGHFNQASGSYSTVGGGRFNFARGAYSTIAGGGGPSIFNDTNSTAGMGNVIGGGAANLTRENFSTISGGHANRALGTLSSVSGGYLNTTFSQGSHIGGGERNEIDGLHGTVGGGTFNYAAGEGATIGGGGHNIVRGQFAVVAGGGGDTNPGDSNSALGDYSSIGGGAQNVAGGPANSVGGGFANVAGGSYSVVAGGANNRTRGQFATVGGGGGTIVADSNAALADYSSIVGGRQNLAYGIASFIGGGSVNIAGGTGTTIGAGVGNRAYGYGDVVGGGISNTTSNDYSTVPGGFANQATGLASFAAGWYALARHEGSFVWADHSSALDSTRSTGTNQFIIRAVGGVGINTNAPQQQLSVGGGMNIDQANQNAGTVTNSLSFGSGSGEAIASRRIVGDNIYGLDFYCNFVNRMSITNAGNVGIGTTAPVTPSGGKVLHVDNPSGPAVLRLGDGAASGVQWELQSTVLGGAGALNFSNVTAFTNPMQLYGNGNLIVAGNVCAANVACPSDARLKKNIRAIPDALNRLERLRGVEYEWTRDAQSQRLLPATEQIGVIAQEVREVVPQAVITQEDGFLAVDYSRLVALLIEGMKEQQQQIDSLQVRLAVLERRP